MQHVFSAIYTKRLAIYMLRKVFEIKLSVSKHYVVVYLLRYIDVYIYIDRCIHRIHMYTRIYTQYTYISMQDNNNKYTPFIELYAMLLQAR